MAATLASGLPEDSRCARRAAGTKAPMSTLLMARISDALELLLWRYCEAGTPKPASILDTLVEKAPKDSNIRTFRSGADFDRELQKFIT